MVSRFSWFCLLAVSIYFPVRYCYNTKKENARCRHTRSAVSHFFTPMSHMEVEDKWFVQENGKGWVSKKGIIEELVLWCGLGFVEQTVHTCGL